MWRARKISPLVGCFSQVTGSNQFVWMLAFVVSYLVQDAKRPLGGICFAYSLVVHKASAGAASVVRGAVFASAGPLPAPTAHGHSLHQRMAACERRATPCTNGGRLASAGPLGAPADGGLRAQDLSGRTLHHLLAALIAARYFWCFASPPKALPNPAHRPTSSPIPQSTSMPAYCSPASISPLAAWGGCESLLLEGLATLTSSPRISLLLTGRQLCHRHHRQHRLRRRGRPLQPHCIRSSRH